MQNIIERGEIQLLRPSGHNFPSLGLVSPLTAVNAPLTAQETTAASSLPTKAVELKLKELFILDNFDGLLEAVFGGSNEIKLVSLVFDGVGAEPFKFEVGSFPGIAKGNCLPLGDAGLALYFSEPKEIPHFLDWRLLIVEDDSNVRNAGKVINQIRATKEYQDIVTTVLALANPTWAAITSITTGVISLVAQAMEQNQDDIISLFAATYTLPFDRLGVGTHTFYHQGHARGTYEILVAQ